MEVLAEPRAWVLGLTRVPGVERGEELVEVRGRVWPEVSVRVAQAFDPPGSESVP